MRILLIHLLAKQIQNPLENCCFWSITLNIALHPHNYCISTLSNASDFDVEKIRKKSISHFITVIVIHCWLKGGANEKIDVNSAGYAVNGNETLRSATFVMDIRHGR